MGKIFNIAAIISNVLVVVLILFYTLGTSPAPNTKEQTQYKESQVLDSYKLGYYKGYYEAIIFPDGDYNKAFKIDSMNFQQKLPIYWKPY